MKYALIKNTIDLVEAFDSSNANQNYSNDIIGFKKWIAENYAENANVAETYWEGKENGRTADSAISTLLVHMNRFAKNYSKAAISGSEFSTQEDFIYLINLKAFGEMTKMELIKKNVHEKPVGILIINRLITKGWVIQEESKTDKRSKVIAITNQGLQVLESQMGKIRKATNMVTGNLTETEKTELIRLLSKLNDFHKPIYEMNLDPENLLDIKNN
ncbi:MarR family winged helix-turn-helix transcriptional regulator [Paenimyroides viscosum]|uniref:MarR family transcriptional regulator n=1 Tax=Paenimyroides viscosum TaxID=2488729 RepID=A0A3P1B7R9_9FLAO|nr:helix-turn-helix domain-containing protein [Paenimyroides viscosum]RRA97125.1 MarR family transcriptional regulator [Paenimyroides viscosum]